MVVSINPSYYCNFRCDWCYLTEHQLADSKLLELDKLDVLLSKIDIDHVDLYGGEVGVLPALYIDSMMSTIRKYYSGRISVTTNLSAVPSWFLNPDIDVAVSYEFEAREKHDIVLRNMVMFPKPLHVIILAHKQVLGYDVDNMINVLNSIANVTSVEIKPYSTNQANEHDVSHTDYEKFVIKWIDSPILKRFTFQNEDKIRNSISKTYNAFSDDHVYITPNGRYAVLEFDLNDREYFLEFDDISFYEDWHRRESVKVYSNNICSKCDYVGHCLTEHYRDVKSLDNGCNGYVNLLRWYEASNSR